MRSGVPAGRLGLVAVGCSGGRTKDERRDLRSDPDATTCTALLTSLSGAASQGREVKKDRASAQSPTREGRDGPLDSTSRGGGASSGNGRTVCSYAIGAASMRL